MRESTILMEHTDRSKRCGWAGITETQMQSDRQAGILLRQRNGRLRRIAANHQAGASQDPGAIGPKNAGVVFG
jgi:hypothetical protein